MRFHGTQRHSERPWPGSGKAGALLRCPRCAHSTKRRRQGTLAGWQSLLGRPVLGRLHPAPRRKAVTRERTRVTGFHRAAQTRARCPPLRPPPALGPPGTSSHRGSVCHTLSPADTFSWTSVFLWLWGLVLSPRLWLRYDTEEPQLTPKPAPHAHCGEEGDPPTAFMGSSGGVLKVPPHTHSVWHFRL